MQDQVVVYSDADSQGLRYVLDFVFNNWFGVGYRLVHDQQEVDGDYLSINYSLRQIQNTLHIAPSGDPFSPDKPSFDEIAIRDWEDLPCFFYHGFGDVPFDLFGAIFFLLTRAEEYGEISPDSHDRFLSTHSVFSGTGIIERPIVDEWLFKLGERMSDQYPQFAPRPREYKWLNTFDIDVAYAYKFRSPWRLFAGFAKDLFRFDLSNFNNRLKVILNRDPDPFDTYELQFTLAPPSPDQTIYFILLGDFGKYDKNLSHRSPGYRRLIKRLSDNARVGIHPSYASNFSAGLIRDEIGRLSEITDSEVKLSRQHYLKISFPSTYRRLISAGISEDYSLGYSDRPGFRSGTCTPHFFYDFEKQEATNLKLFPLTVMDASLRDYMMLEPSAATNYLKKLIARVKAVNGTFVSLWHNESLSDSGVWKGWREVYIEMTKDAFMGLPVKDDH